MQLFSSRLDFRRMNIFIESFWHCGSGNGNKMVPNQSSEDHDVLGTAMRFRYPCQRFLRRFLRASEYGFEFLVVI